MTHDQVRAVCTQDDNPRMLRERIIAIAGFTLVGVSLVLGSWLI
jgi:hypothetical protein